MAAVLQQLDHLERDVCIRINQFARHTGVRRFFSLISKLGDGGLWAAFGVLLYIRHGNPILPDILKMALVAGLGVLIYKLLKGKLIRHRPYVSHEPIECGTAPLDQYSFPSGHTLHAVSFTLMFAQLDPLVAALAVPFAALIAVSRVLLGLHYPSDVLVGALIGAALALGIA